jgi:hypothetical protein
MKRFTPTILGLILTMIISQTVLAGNIAGGRTAGHIPVGRAAGHIATGRTGTSTISTSVNPEGVATQASKFDFETMVSGSFAGLIRMLLDAGALL